MNYIHLKKWTLPSSYIGKSWPEYYVFLGQNRDSDTLTRSNFIEGLNNLGGESETVLVVSENHWLCGYIEWIAIHESDVMALEQADKMLEKIENYPILNENAFSEMEYEEYYEAWESYGKGDFAESLQKELGLSNRLTEYLKEKTYLCKYYEGLISSGEYFTNDNSGISLCIDIAVESATRESLASFVKNKQLV